VLGTIDAVEDRTMGETTGCGARRWERDELHDR
jgi:hypothetical protein